MEIHRSVDNKHWVLFGVCLFVNVYMLLYTHQCSNINYLSKLKAQKHCESASNINVTDQYAYFYFKDI